jgi:peptide/nickel transport system substrate-binding protein
VKAVRPLTRYAVVTVSVIVGALSLSGCERAPVEGIRLGIPTAPLTLDPRFATDAMSARLSRLLHAPLVEFDSAAQAVPGLADWRLLSPLHYRFTLHADARFHNGRPITAADVAATYRAVLDPALASPLREALRNIATVQALDARTIDFLLQRADSLFPATLGIGVMAAADARGARDSWHSASGPFSREDWRSDGNVVLRRRSDGERVEVVVVKDATVRALKLIAGELDVAQGNLPPEIIAWLATRPGLRVVEHNGTTFSYLGFNLSHGPLRDQRVRAAISHAIDRDAVVHYLFHDRAQPAAALLPPSHWAAAPDLSVPRYDPALARALLAAAGYAGQRLRLHYKTSADAFRLRLATLLQSQLAEVGIDLVIDSLDWATFYADVGASRFEIYGLSWVGLKLPDIFRQAFHSAALAPNGLNRGHYREAEVDALIEAAESETSLARQRLLYQAIARRLLYDLPYVPLWFETQTAVLRADIEAYAIDADGSFDGLTTIRRVSHHEHH